MAEKRVTVTVRLPQATYKRLSDMKKKTGVPIQKSIELALEALLKAR